MLVYSIYLSEFSIQNSAEAGYCPTKRAPDAGDSAQISSIFLAPAFFSSDGVPPSAPAPVTQTVGLFLAQLSKKPSWVIDI